MSIIRDHSITKILKNRELRNDPEVLDAVCNVLRNLDIDIDKVGELIVGSKTDEALEELNTAVIRAETPSDEDEDEVEEDPFEEDEEE